MKNKKLLYSLLVILILIFILTFFINPFDWPTNTNLNKNNNIQSEETQLTEDKKIFSYNSYGGYQEGLFVELNTNNLKDINAYYSTNNKNWFKVDKELIYKTKKGNVRIDILGLKPGKYWVKITKSNYKNIIISNINVTSHDRSGYAHYDIDNTGKIIKRQEGVGAYNNDGTLKKDAIVLYVTDQNKNSVKLDK